LPQAVKQTSAQAAVAAVFNVSLVAYEAGPGLVQDGVISGQSATGAVTELLIAAARDDRMQPFYEEALRELRSAGLYSGRERPLPVFTSAGAFSMYGTWGHIEYTRQPTQLTPKYRAVQPLSSGSSIMPQGQPRECSRLAA